MLLNIRYKYDSQAGFPAKCWLLWTQIYCFFIFLLGSQGTAHPHSTCLTPVSPQALSMWHQALTATAGEDPHPQAFSPTPLLPGDAALTCHEFPEKIFLLKGQIIFTQVVKLALCYSL